jgi:decaprenyl-phosphate phosphoribosyltransferase
MQTSLETLIVRPSAADLFLLLRPGQWVKNVFVLLPLLFSGSVFNPGRVMAAMLACAAFCLASSAVYVLNDVLDAPADRLHPRKRGRPIAAGRVSPRAASILGIAVAVSALMVGCLGLPPVFLAMLGLYQGVSILYCVWLKHRVIVDVMVVACGFVLRLLGGCIAIGVVPSAWILVCGFSLAMVLGFGKRRCEITSFGSDSGIRPALSHYNAAKLDMLLAITVSVALISYMLYTVSPETVQIHNTDHLTYTVPFVAYGLFRYLFKTQEGKEDGPTEILSRDPIFLMNGALWLAAVWVVLYLFP